MDRLPNFLIIGAMRSGTTGLSNYLSAHPNVFMAQPKELHYFDLNFVEAIAAEPERLNTTDCLTRYWYSYIDRRRYLPQLRRICEYYPREALLVLLLEELRDAPVETFHLVCRFLEIDDNVIPSNLGARINAYATFRSIRLRTALKDLPPNSLLRRVLGRLNIHRSEAYPPLPLKVRDMLQNRFETDNAALASWLGCDLSVWKA